MRTLCLGNRIKLDHLPAGSQVTERREKQYQVSGVRRLVAQIPFCLGSGPSEK